MAAHWLISFSTYGTWLPPEAAANAPPQAAPLPPPVPPARTPSRRSRSRPPGVRIRDGPSPFAAPALRSGEPRSRRDGTPIPRARARISDGPPLPAVGRYAPLAARAAPVHLTRRQARLVIAQLRETARARGWVLRAAAVTRDGVRAVVTVETDPAPSMVIADLKGDGSRALDAGRGAPARRWWNAGGGGRPVHGDDLGAAMRAVRDQRDALAAWLDPCWP